MVALAVALQLFGLASLLSVILGPNHHHVETVAAQDPMAGWQDFRRAHHVGDAPAPAHAHVTIGRHRHEAGDADVSSVVRLGADERDGGLNDAAVSVPPLVAALSLWGAVPLAVLHREADAGWSMDTACTFASCLARRLDRPPIG